MQLAADPGRLKSSTTNPFHLYQPLQFLLSGSPLPGAGKLGDQMLDTTGGYHDPLIALSFRIIQQTGKKKEPPTPVF
jgi:hypothetical protein